MALNVETVYAFFLLSICSVAAEVCTSNVQATVGARVTLCCRPTVDQPVVWFFTGRSQADMAELSNSGEILSDYVQYYELDTTRMGNYHLVIKSVRLQDAGVYVCQEDNGIGDSHQLNLTVSESTTVPLVSDNTYPAKGSPPDSSGQRSHVLAIFIASIVTAVTTTAVIGVVVFAVLRCLNCKRQVAKPLIESEWQVIYNEIQQNNEHVTVINQPVDLDYDKLRNDSKLFRKYVQLFVDHIRVAYSGRKLDSVVEVQCELEHGREIARKLRLKLVRATARRRSSFDVTSDGHKRPLFIRQEDCNPGDNVVIVDEKLVTGDSLKFVLNTMEQMGVKVLGCVVLVEDLRFKTRQQHADELKVELKSFVQQETADDRSNQTSSAEFIETDSFK